MTARWRKSSYSGSTNGGCVEVAFAETVGVRDSKNTSGPTLTFDSERWRAFTVRQAPRR